MSCRSVLGCVARSLRLHSSTPQQLFAVSIATSVAQEQSRVTAERAQMTSEKAMRELQMLQLTQQTTAAELKNEVAKIGLRIQEQSDKTLFQEQSEERTTRSNYGTVVSKDAS